MTHDWANTNKSYKLFDWLCWTKPDELLNSKLSILTINQHILIHSKTNWISVFFIESINISKGYKWLVVIFTSLCLEKFRNWVSSTSRRRIEGPSRKCPRKFLLNRAKLKVSRGRQRCEGNARRPVIFKVFLKNDVSWGSYVSCGRVGTRKVYNILNTKWNTFLSIKYVTELLLFSPMKWWSGSYGYSTHH